MPARYTWRKGATRQGRMRLAPSYTLHHGSDAVLVRVQQHHDGWYWYGLGMNTANEKKSLDEARADALAYVKAQMADQS